MRVSFIENYYVQLAIVTCTAWSIAFTITIFLRDGNYAAMILLGALQIIMAERLRLSLSRLNGRR